MSHVINSRAVTGEKPCINRAIHALLMHGYATFNMIVPGPQNCCRYEMCRLTPVVFVLYLFFFFSTLFFLSWSSLIQLQVTYGWTKTFLSSQGTEVNKNSTSYTSVVSPQKKKKKKKEKKNKERVWGQTTRCVVPGPRTSRVRGNCVRETSVKRRNKIVQEITRNVANVFSFYAIIAIEHVF